MMKTNAYGRGKLNLANKGAFSSKYIPYELFDSLEQTDYLIATIESSNHLVNLGDKLSIPQRPIC